LKTTKFPQEFKLASISGSLSGLEPNLAYSLTKRNNESVFNQVLGLIPSTGYTSKKEIQSVELIYSGSAGIYQISLMVGRLDTENGTEHLNIDHFNFAPTSGSTDSYFLEQHHHTKDTNGNRFTFEISPFRIPNDKVRENALYSGFLTGSLTSCSFDDYEQNKKVFFEVHKSCFE